MAAIIAAIFLFENSLSTLITKKSAHRWEFMGGKILTID